MTDELNTKLALIKEQCREIVALSEAAPEGPWHSYDCEFGGPSGVADPSGRVVVSSQYTHTKTLTFIARTRTIGPEAAKALIQTIEALEQIRLSIGVCSIRVAGLIWKIEE